MLQIHQKIKQARLSAGLTEAELAEKIGVKRSTYQYWETKTPAVENIKRVSRALGKHDDYFFGSDESFVSEPEPTYNSREVQDKTIFNLSEANIILAKAVFNLSEKVNSGAPSGVSSVLPVRETVSADPTEKMQQGKQDKKVGKKDSGFVVRK